MNEAIGRMVERLWGNTISTISGSHPLHCRCVGVHLSLRDYSDFMNYSFWSIIIITFIIVLHVWVQGIPVALAYGAHEIIVILPSISTPHWWAPIRAKQLSVHGSSIFVGWLAGEGDHWLPSIGLWLPQPPETLRCRRLVDVISSD